MSEFLIRSIKKEEIPLLERFLYLAIFVPENSDPPPYSIIYNKELQVYIEDLGERKDDHILVADVDGKIVGGAWVRIMDDYGHLDDETPSLIISVEKEYIKGEDLQNWINEKVKVLPTGQEAESDYIRINIMEKADSEGVYPAVKRPCTYQFDSIGGDAGDVIMNKMTLAGNGDAVQGTFNVTTKTFTPSTTTTSSSSTT